MTSFQAKNNLHQLRRVINSLRVALNGLNSCPRSELTCDPRLDALQDVLAFERNGREFDAKQDSVALDVQPESAVVDIAPDAPDEPAAPAEPVAKPVLRKKKSKTTKDTEDEPSGKVKRTKSLKTKMKRSSSFKTKKSRASLNGEDGAESSTEKRKSKRSSKT
eukprot:3233179-Pleurochrysis_carterae.AAC.1